MHKLTIKQLFRYFATSIVVMLATNCPLLAQTKIDTDTYHAFWISKARRLKDNDIAAKREGVDKDILPQLGYDDLTGFNFGVVGSFFNNGQKNDSLFYYSDYRYRIDFELGGSYKKKQPGLFSGDDELYIKFDAPYFLNGPYRFSASLNIENNPYNLYYGINTASFKIKNAATANDPYYNYFRRIEKYGEVKIERMLFKGFLWPYLTIGYADENVIPVANSLLKQHADEQLVNGTGRTQIPMLRMGLRYDTRNNEENPTRGMVIELGEESSFKPYPTGFKYQKTFFNFNIYTQLGDTSKNAVFHFLSLPLLNKKDAAGNRNKNWGYEFFNENTLAFRFALGMVNGKAPFYAYQHYETSQTDIAVLGGNESLRGYAQSRFVGRVSSFVNIELRSNIYRLEHLSPPYDGGRSSFYELGLVPFIDIGGAWDTLSDYLHQYNNYRVSGGMGARLNVDSNFTIRFDYAVSAEGKFSILSLSQTF